VADFNTYDILKQRYLLLTREALAVLKQRVKEKAGRRRAPGATPAEDQAEVAATATATATATDAEAVAAPANPEG
jgi:hypothetical protein